MTDKKKMSVAEILAAARAEGQAADAGDTSSAEDKPDAAPAAEAAAPAASKPAAPKAGAGGRPSVQDILAMARSGAEKPAAEAPKPAAAKPAAKPAAKKPAAEKAAPAGQGAKKNVQRDTASILAAARAGAKPGPVSKAEAPAAVRPAAKPAGKPAAKPVRPVPPRPTRPQATVAAKKPATEERRSFLSYALGSFMAVGFTALSVTGGLFSLGLARFLFPNVLAEPPSRFKVGSKEGFPSGKVETKFVAQYGVWVVNSEFEGVQQIYALKTVCTHLGCTPNWLEAEQKFKCPCHGSGFYKDGINFEGPAPRPLERYAIRVADDGQLEVDKSKSFQEELGQWNNPESFVTA